MSAMLDKRTPVRYPLLPKIAEGADWTALAACRGSDPEELFVTGAAQNKVKTRCFSCLVRTECLADALDNRVEFGVWGGMTERERRALLRRRPDVPSWQALLMRARSESQGPLSGATAARDALEGLGLADLVAAAIPVAVGA